MYMAPKDDRIRRYDIIDDLKKKRHDIQEIISKGNEVQLHLSFTYTFAGELKTVHVQKYKWELDGW